MRRDELIYDRDGSAFALSARHRTHEIVYLGEFKSLQDAIRMCDNAANEGVCHRVQRWSRGVGDAAQKIDPSNRLQGPSIKRL